MNLVDKTWREGIDSLVMKFIIGYANDKEKSIQSLRYNTVEVLLLNTTYNSLVRDGSVKKIEDLDKTEKHRLANNFEKSENLRQQCIALYTLEKTNELDV